MAQYRRMDVKIYEAAGLINVRKIARTVDDRDMHLVLGVTVVKGGDVVLSGGIEHYTRTYSKATGCSWEGEAVSFECPASYFGQPDFKVVVLIFHRSEYSDHLAEVGQVWVSVPATTTDATTLTVSTKKGKQAGTLKLAVTVGPVVMRLVAVEAPAPAAQTSQRNSSGTGLAIAVGVVSQLLADSIKSMLSL